MSELDTILYEDNNMKLTNKELILFLYWFPFGFTKKIRMEKIKKIIVEKRGPLGSKKWGMGRCVHYSII